MKRVIERCPNCGVEHDDPKGGACEVCGTTLRFWCRVHSKEIGWLDSATCPRCAAEAARPTPPPRAPAAPPPAAEPPPRRPTPPTPRVPDSPPPPRRPAPTPPPARVEEEGPVWVEVPIGRPRRTRRPRPWGGRDPGVVLREGAEDLAPYAEVGATMAVRAVRAFFALVRSVIFWGLLGAVGGFFFPQYAGEIGVGQDPVWTAMAGAMVGGGLGLFFGTIRATRILFSQRRGPGG